MGGSMLVESLLAAISVPVNDGLTAKIAPLVVARRDHQHPSARGRSASCTRMLQVQASPGILMMHRDFLENQLTADIAFAMREKRRETNELHSQAR